MHTVAGNATAAANGLMKLKKISRYGKKKLTYGGQRLEGMEVDGIGSQDPQRTVVLEEKEKEENKRRFPQLVK
jgi:hypothetical protein